MNDPAGDPPNLYIRWRQHSTKHLTKALVIPWHDNPFTLSIESSASISNDQIHRQRYAPANAIMLRQGHDAAPLELARDMGPISNLQHVFGQLTLAFGPEAQRRYAAHYKRAAKRQPETEPQDTNAPASAATAGARPRI